MQYDTILDIDIKRKWECMIEKKTWDEFRECKMLWWINMILHTFGWAIVVELNEDKILNAYPARVKYRGFDEKCNTEGYIGISKFMKENAKKLLEEAEN